jgi:hypothetical protein
MPPRRSDQGAAADQVAHYPLTVLLGEPATEATRQSRMPRRQAAQKLQLQQLMTMQLLVPMLK